MAADGKTTYEIEGDYRELIRDLDEALKKVEESGKKAAQKSVQIQKESSESVKKTAQEVTEHHEQQNDQRVKDDEETGKKRQEVEKSVGEKLKSIAGDAARDMAADAAGALAGGTVKAIGSGIIGAGEAVVSVGEMAVKGAVEMDQAMNQFIASTGKGREESERYQKVLEDIYTDNYGDSFGDIAGAMAEVNEQMGDMSDEQLQSMTESAYALRDTFGYEIPESAQAAKTMMDDFGVSGEEAMSLIAAGAQNGLDSSGELLDSIGRYSEQFAKLGLDADDMFNIFQACAESGTFSMEAVGSAIEEFSARAAGGSAEAADGFARLGLNADEMAARFAAGGDTAKQAFQETAEALASMDDPLEQNLTGADLFGGAWKELGPEVMEQLAGMQDGAYDTAEAMNGLKGIQCDDLGSMLEGLKRSLETLLIPLGEQLTPILENLVQAILPVLEEVLPPILDVIGQLVGQLAPMVEEIMPVLSGLLEQLLPPISEIISSVLPILTDLIGALLPIFQQLLEALSPIIDCFMKLLEPVLQLIGEALRPLAEALTPIISAIMEGLVPQLEVLQAVFGEVFEGVMSVVDTCIGSILNIFNNLIDFVKNVFAGNWKAAWGNVKEILKSVADSIGAVFKVPINALIDLINGFIKGINGIKIPDWVPEFGGRGFSLPLIPRLKAGVDFVPEDFYPAYLDYGERVLTQRENIRFNSLGGLAGMETALSRGDYHSDQKIVLGKGCIVVQADIDGRTAAQAMAPHMDTVLGNVKEVGGRA